MGFPGPVAVMGQRKVEVFDSYLSGVQSKSQTVSWGGLGKGSKTMHCGMLLKDGSLVSIKRVNVHVFIFPGEPLLGSTSTWLDLS